MAVASVRPSVRSRVAFPALAVTLGLAASAHAGVIFSETFADDPIANSRAVVVGENSPNRFTFSSGQLTAAYDTARPTTKLVWALPYTINQSRDFSFSTTFTIQSAGFFADPDGFAQIGFGLVNTVTTGLDRTGTFVSGADTFDMVAVDYFPNINPTWGGPTLSPTLFQSGPSGSDAFDGMVFPWAPESGLDEEADLPRGVQLTARVAYDTLLSRLTLTLRNDTLDQLIPINLVGLGNAVGGPDGDIYTITSDLPPGAVFSTDAFALTLWNDYFAEFGEVRANVTFHAIEVSLVPEPGSLALLGVASLALLRRRR